MAQSSGTTVVLDGTLTFEGTLTLTIPPGYESLPTPEATPAPAPALPAPPPVTLPPPPILEVVPAPPAQANVPYAVPQAGAGAAAPDATPAPRMRRRWGLVVSGSLMLVGGWALGIGMGLSGRAASAWPFVPFGGSLVQISVDNDGGRIAFYVASSALQIAGFIMAIVGTASRRPVRDRTAPRVSVAPLLSDEVTGLAVGGTF